jgi:hypothetical protein
LSADDCAQARRAVRRSKAFAILTLAGGIAGTTSIFALVQGGLLTPMAGMRCEPDDSRRLEALLLTSQR